MRLILERLPNWEGWKVILVLELRAKTGTEDEDTYYQIFRQSFEEYYGTTEVVEPEFQYKVMDKAMTEGWKRIRRYIEEYVKNGYWQPNGILGQPPYKVIENKKLPLVWWIE